MKPLRINSQEKSYQKTKLEVLADALTQALCFNAYEHDRPYGTSGFSPRLKPLAYFGKTAIFRNKNGVGSIDYRRAIENDQNVSPQDRIAFYNEIEQRTGKRTSKEEIDDILKIDEISKKDNLSVEDESFLVDQFNKRAEEILQFTLFYPYPATEDVFNFLKNPHTNFREKISIRGIPKSTPRVVGYEMSDVRVSKERYSFLLDGIDPKLNYTPNFDVRAGKDQLEKGLLRVMLPITQPRRIIISPERANHIFLGTLKEVLNKNEDLIRDNTINRISLNFIAQEHPVYFYRFFIQFCLGEWKY